jgi:hypothetical protein
MLPLRLVYAVQAAAMRALRFSPFYTTPRRVVGYHKRGDLRSTVEVWESAGETRSQTLRIVAINLNARTRRLATFAEGSYVAQTAPPAGPSCLRDDVA